MYALGLPGHLSAKPVFCEHCMAAMMINLPEELAELAGVAVTDSGEAELLEKIDALTLDNTDKALRISELEALVSTLVPPTPGEATVDSDAPDLSKDDQTPDAGEPAAEAQEETPAEVDEDPSEQPIRCLDCNEEFASKSSLARHKKRLHPEG